MRLPEKHKDRLERFVRQHQSSKSDPESAPFRRQLDLWAFSIAIAVASGTPPAKEPSTVWGTKFADTKSVQLSEGLCGFLATIAYTHARLEGSEASNPAQIIEIANRYAAAGSDQVIGVLANAGPEESPLSAAMRLTTRETSL